MKQPGEQIDDDKTQQQDGDDSQHVRSIPRSSANANARRRFRPSPALTIAAVVLILLCARLSVWQFDRAEQKASLEQSARESLAAAPEVLSGDTPLRPYLRAAAAGVYLPQKQIFLDNRVRDKIAGMHIITPLLLDDGAAVAVNRGFVARDATPPPPPEGRVTVRGVLQKDGADAFTLSSQTESGDLWQNLDLQKYAAAADLPLLTLALFAQNVAAPAEVRVDFRSARSIGYALQWATFGALAFIFYLVLSFRK